MIEPAAAIKKKLDEKAKRYGSVDRPYVVAVSPESLFVDDVEICDALFGGEPATVVTLTGFGTGFEREIREEGAWRGQSAPRNRAISAALMCVRLSPWSVARAELRLYHNPWAERPYAGEVNRLAQAVVEGGAIKRLPGQAIAEILRIPPNWPHV